MGKCSVCLEIGIRQRGKSDYRGEWREKERERGVSHKEKFISMMKAISSAKTLRVNETAWKSNGG